MAGKEDGHEKHPIPPPPDHIATDSLNDIHDLERSDDRTIWLTPYTRPPSALNMLASASAPDVRNPLRSEWAAKVLASSPSAWQWFLTISPTTSAPSAAAPLHDLGRR